MLVKIYDSLLALIFLGMTIFGASTFYNVVKREALLRVSKGLSSTHRFTRALTGESFDWEK